jgi:hypothetical protein
VLGFLGLGGTWNAYWVERTGSRFGSPRERGYATSENPDGDTDVGKPQMKG